MPREKFNLAECPGYLEAVKKENDIRDAAMVCGETKLCGIPVRQLTLRLWVILDAIDTPFARGINPEPLDIVRFLWVLSPQFKANAPFRRYLFARACRKLPYGIAALACQRFWDDAFQDRPPTSGSPMAGFVTPQVSFAANVIYQVCRAVTVSKCEVMDMPLKEAFQYMKLARMRAAAENGDAHSESNPSDLIRANWIREQRRLDREKARAN